MSQITLRTLPLDQLSPAPYNPRKVLSPTSPAYRKLKASLESFGLVEPLVWNERTGHIVGGHARLRILRDLGIAEVPVSVVNLTDERERALNVMLNNLEAQGRYDPKLLLDLLEPMREMPEFDLTGFDASMLDALKFALSSTMRVVVSEIALPAPPITPASATAPSGSAITRFDESSV